MIQTAVCPTRQHYRKKEKDTLWNKSKTLAVLVLCFLKRVKNVKFGGETLNNLLSDVRQQSTSHSAYFKE